MPIQIDQAKAEALASRFEEALELVHNEFKGLNPHQQYRNAFARLLKSDPLDRVRMMGTDQRDGFVRELCRSIEKFVPRAGHILDLGAGDGQTFALVAGVVPEGVRVSIEEPNPNYIADYRAFLQTQPHLRLGMALVAGFDEIDKAAERTDSPLPADDSIDLCLALHMIYFLNDLSAGLTRMVRFLKPGGALFCVFADETDGYTGLVLKSFIDSGGDTGDNPSHLSAIRARRRLLASPAEGGGGILDQLRAVGAEAKLEAVYQPSRLYGHSLADLIALSSIAVLSSVEDLAKFDVAADLLRHESKAVDLRIEDDGPRKGMWSVTQPQWISIVRRLPDA